MSEGPAARKQPTQKRSRERVERILAVAREIIEASGSEAMKMSDVATRADISIGSLYQYFPDKAAIIRTLAEHYNALGQHCIEEALAEVSDATQLKRAFTALVDTYYGMFLAEPVMRDIWSAMQADKALRAIQLAESRTNAVVLSAVLKRLRPQADPTLLDTTALMVMHLGEEAMRLAVSVPRAEGDRLFAAYKRMAIRQLGDAVAG